MIHLKKKKQTGGTATVKSTQFTKTQEQLGCQKAEQRIANSGELCCFFAEFLHMLSSPRKWGPQDPRSLSANMCQWSCKFKEASLARKCISHSACASVRWKVGVWGQLLPVPSLGWNECRLCWAGSWGGYSHSFNSSSLRTVWHVYPQSHFVTIGFK